MSVFDSICRQVDFLGCEVWLTTKGYTDILWIKDQQTGTVSIIKLDKEKPESSWDLSKKRKREAND